MEIETADNVHRHAKQFTFINPPDAICFKKAPSIYRVFSPHVTIPPDLLFIAQTCKTFDYFSLSQHLQMYFDKHYLLFDYLSALRNIRFCLVVGRSQNRILNC